MRNPAIVIALIVLFVAFELGRIWHSKRQYEKTELALQQQAQMNIDSLAQAKIDQHQQDLDTEWQARFEQEQEMQALLKDSIRMLQEELAIARHGKLKELVERLGEKGIRKKEKKLLLKRKQALVEPVSKLTLFLERVVPQTSATVKMTRPHKQTETVTWKPGEAYYLKDEQAQSLIEVFVLSITKTQAVLRWTRYSGF